MKEIFHHMLAISIGLLFGLIIYAVFIGGIGLLQMEQQYFNL